MGTGAGGSGVEGGAGRASVEALVVVGEAGGVEESPAGGDPGDGLDCRVGVDQVAVCAAQPYVAQVGQGVVSRWLRKAYCKARGVT